MAGGNPVCLDELRFRARSTRHTIVAALGVMLGAVPERHPKIMRYAWGREADEVGTKAALGAGKPMGLALRPPRRGGITSIGHEAARVTEAG